MQNSLKAISFVFVFLMFVCLITDVNKALQYKSDTKDALDFATKAAALQIDKTAGKIAEGVFDIDPVLSKTVFEEYLKDNLESNDNVMVYVMDYRAINVHTSTQYTSLADSRIYTIDKPTFFAVIKFQFKGIFLNVSVLIDNLSGSTLLGK